MKVALCFLPSWLPYAPPLGISAVSSFIKNDGHEVDLYDFNVEFFQLVPKEKRKFWDTEFGSFWMTPENYVSEIEPFIIDGIRKKAKVLAFSDYQAIGFSIYSSNYLPTITLIRLLRNISPQLKIFLGGPGINEDLVTENLKSNLIDGAVFGEGEIGVRDLLDYWEGKKNFNDCKGIMSFNAQGNPEKKSAHNLLKMKDLPVPDFSAFDLDSYFGRTLPIEFSRGCIANCTFCSETNYWVSFRTKTVDQIVDEFKLYVERYNIQNFRVVDSLMNGNMKFLKELANRLIAEKLGVEWYGFCRIDPKLDDETLSLLRKAGCTAIIYGLESGSQKVLDLMKKKVKMKDQYEVVQNTAKNGIKVYGEILVGFPGENLVDFLKTMWMLLRLRSSVYGVSTGAPMSVVRNSEVYDHPERFGVTFTPDGWRAKGCNTPFTRNLRFKIMNLWVKVLRFN